MDLIERQKAIDAFMTSTSDGDKAEWCKWVLEQLPSAQKEIIRCKDCKYAINIGTPDMMCKNSKAWVVATDNNFGCVFAERRTDESD